jgi:hypothetical protein
MAIARARTGWPRSRRVSNCSAAGSRTTAPCCGCASRWPPTAASSSKNAKRFLAKIRLDTFAQDEGIDSASMRPGLTLVDFVCADVSGRDFAHGRPDPRCSSG